jgi:cyclopropane fatty-acyl-phospholipid synthase-like methyltransferase
MKTLDVGCADGRHAIGLAARGVQVSGIATSVPFLLVANQMAQELGQTATFIKKDMREYVPANLLDAVICFGGTFGYFSDAENADQLRRFASWLAPGGKLLLEVMHRDYVVSQLPSRIWWEGNGCMVMDECYFQYSENRLLVKRNAAFATGKQRNYQLTIRAYTLREISDLAEAAGFRILSVSGSVYTPGAFTGQLSPAIILVLQK